eukprot:Lankesteria_metandrocarpae@DN3503_c0_g1_i1.p1
MKVEALRGVSVNLVPFEARHVGLYLAWMRDDYLVRMTATDADLTLEDVTDMQRSWHEDTDKFVFLISAKRIDRGAGITQRNGGDLTTTAHHNTLCAGTGTDTTTAGTGNNNVNGGIDRVSTEFKFCSSPCEQIAGSGNDACDTVKCKIIDANVRTGGIDECTNSTLRADHMLGFEDEVLVGDVGLFFSVVDGVDHKDRVIYDEGELSFMVAYEEYRKQGIGREAVGMVMEYANRELGTKRFTAKVAICNATCLRMLMKMGFVEVSRNEIFQEVSLELRWG